MPSGSVNNDVKITVVNDTNDDYYFVLFTQDTNIKGMWTNIFPTAWQVIPLSGKDNSNSLQNSRNVFTYPIAMEAAVMEHNTPYAPNTTTTNMSAQFSDQFEYYTNPQGFNHLKKLDTKNFDDTISVKNSVNKLVDMAVLKNGVPLVVFRGQHQKGVAKGDSAGLLLTPKIYIWYTGQIQQGELFVSQIAASESREIDLTKYTNDITVTLKYKDYATEEKEWVVANV